MKRSTALGIAAGAIAGCVLSFAVGRHCPSSGASNPHAAPAVVLAIHDVARLETTVFHVEKVIEVSREQSRLWGLVTAKDALMLIAVGDVTAGVDLGKVGDRDVTVDPTTHAVHVRVPPPELLGCSLDERATHVYARSTDALAVRNEQLEGDARRVAEEQMRAAALDDGILDRARANADTTLRTLLRSLGYEHVDVDWSDRG